MFDLNYYDELDELITLDYDQEDYYNNIRQRRYVRYNKYELMDADAKYIRFAYLQSKHIDFYEWFYINYLLLNRTRRERFSIIQNNPKPIKPLSRRKILRSYN